MSNSKPRKKSTTQPSGRAISMSGPLDEIIDRMSNPVGNVYIVSCHGCRTGKSFVVNKNISVVTTSRHQYKASSPTVVKVGDTYSVIEPTKSIGQNVADAKTISDLIESIQNSIVPQVEPATKKHPLSKGTRAVIKMRDRDSQPMTIPESQLFVAGKQISGFEGVFFVNRQTRHIDDVTTRFGLVERKPEDRMSRRFEQTPHPQHDSLSHIIKRLEDEISNITSHYSDLLSKPNPTPEESSERQQLRHYIQGKENDIQMLKIELENTSVLGKYKYVAQGTDGTIVERDVLFSDIANHPTIQDGDVIILHACNGICDERTSLMHGESTADRNLKLSAIKRTRSSDTGQDNVLTGLIYRDDIQYSDGGENMGGGNSKLKTKTKRKIKMKKYKRLTMKRRALRRKLRRSRNRSYRKSYRI